MPRPRSSPWAQPAPNPWPAARSLCRLIFGTGDARLSWTPLVRNDRGVAVELPRDHTTLDLHVTGDFDGAALVLESSSNGVDFGALCAPLRKPGGAAINARPRYVRPVVEGGGPDVLIVVSLVARKAAT